MTTPDGVRLTQQPIAELQQLRGQQWQWRYRFPSPDGKLGGIPWLGMPIAELGALDRVLVVGGADVSAGVFDDLTGPPIEVVGHDEVDAAKPRVDHVVDGVAACAQAIKIEHALDRGRRRWSGFVLGTRGRVGPEAATAASTGLAPWDEKVDRKRREGTVPPRWPDSCRARPS